MLAVVSDNVGFQEHASLIDHIDLLNGQRQNKKSFFWYDGDQVFLLQPSQGIPDGCTAHLQIIAEKFLIHKGVRGIFAVNDLFFDFLVCNLF